MSEKYSRWRKFWCGIFYEHVWTTNTRQRICECCHHIEDFPPNIGGPRFA